MFGGVWDIILEGSSRINCVRQAVSFIDGPKIGEIGIWNRGRSNEEGTIRFQYRTGFAFNVGDLDKGVDGLGVRGGCALHVFNDFISSRYIEIASVNNWGARICGGVRSSN